MDIIETVHNMLSQEEKIKELQQTIESLRKNDIQSNEQPSCDGLQGEFWPVLEEETAISGRLISFSPISEKSTAFEGEPEPNSLPHVPCRSPRHYRDHCPLCDENLKKKVQRETELLGTK